MDTNNNQDGHSAVSPKKRNFRPLSMNSRASTGLNGNYWNRNQPISPSSSATRCLRNCLSSELKSAKKNPTIKFSTQTPIRKKFAEEASPQIFEPTVTDEKRGSDPGSGSGNDESDSNTMEESIRNNKAVTTAKTENRPGNEKPDLSSTRITRDSARITKSTRKECRRVRRNSKAGRNRKNGKAKESLAEKNPMVADLVGNEAAPETFNKNSALVFVDAEPSNPDTQTRCPCCPETHESRGGCLFKPFNELTWTSAVNDPMFSKSFQISEIYPRRIINNNNNDSIFEVNGPRLFFWKLGPKTTKTFYDIDSVIVVCFSGQVQIDGPFESHCLEPKDSVFLQNQRQYHLKNREGYSCTVLCTKIKEQTFFTK